MAPSAQAHRRSHSLLLLQKLLNQRDSASPLTLILDSLEQSAGPLVHEFISRAKTSKAKVVFVSLATVRRPRDADVFVKARGKPLKALASEIASHCAAARPPAVSSVSSHARGATPPSQKYLIVIDSLNALASGHGSQLLPAFFAGVISAAASLVAVYHSDVPVVLPRTATAGGEYEPHALTLLLHLATTVFRVSSLHQAVAVRRAQSRSLPEPEWGLREGREGVLVGLVKSSGHDNRDARRVDGLVVDMEMRRRSGRAVAEKFVLAGSAGITLLSDHPLFAGPQETGADGGGGAKDGAGDGEADTTFSLGLTDKQRKDREGIVLPYFDAQTDIGAGEGGRILYEMGREDDWDDEEDEI
ncbi:Elongator complex protein 5 [Lasiosphaeria miniovina]|uniref:Elongator complex protein 5 n=1 Tax=Lasiosphaeria miniovina TaxID=1954250 RepID=A0AA40E4M9_9PEZI|nr:Elongator complex protein 5 [Lasiosphaeria miniovina]KAK0727984.1 Elongator complex protein 5 [Lasiosphaeria miniovina]